MTVVPGTTIGPYEVVSLLGAGGMGEVYLAIDSRLGRRVALKLLHPDVVADPQRRQRFEREARLAAALQHAHICTIHEIGEAGGQPFIAMEYIEGVSLDAKVRSGPLPVEQAIAIGLQIADALDAAHAHHIVHRDLKGANVVLTPRGDIKILDFGIAKRLDEPVVASATTEGRLSETGILVGTAACMSPEQALGEAVDHRSDLFSFGILLYELLTGRQPFTGPTSMAVVNAILRDTPPAIPRFNESVPDALVRVVNKLLEKNRDERYQLARDVYNDLRRLEREGTGEAPIATRGPARAGRPLAIAAAIGVVVAGAAFLWWMRARTHGLDAAPSIVVLPAEISGPQSVAQFDYLKDAVPATLSTKLSAIDGLETKVPPTNLEWEAARRDVQKIVHAYDVKFYLSPHVYAEPNRLAMTLQLVQSDTRKMVWSHDYAGSSGEYLTLIGQAAADLRQILRPQSARTATHVGDAPTSEAELAFQEGHYYWDRFNNLHEAADADRAEQALTRALKLDPGKADAAAELAFLYEFRFEGGAPISEMLPEMARWTREALRIDPRCGLALTALADMEYLKPAPDMSVAIHNALKGAFYAPRRPIAHNLVGITLRNASSTLSFEAMRQASRLDPFYRAVLNNLTYLLFGLNRSAEAVAMVDEALARQVAPSLAGSKVEALLDLGRLDEAQAIVDQYPRRPGAPRTAGIIGQEYAFLETRRDPAAAERLAELLPFLEKPDLSNYTFTSTAQRVLPFLGKNGRTDAALRLFQAGAAHGWLPAYDLLTTDSRLTGIRRDPRFDVFLRSSRSRMDAVLAVLDDTRQNGELPAYLVQPLQDLRAKLNARP